ncbi:helix-turn-helix domain-containing protein [Micromonospora sp. DT81.3]|uniref:helix-turn-helix domain-containing protein n=1 Tax=Micromonospora sp. DT81.3 TaxID=3416523 RepID=UPI003CFB5868
MEHVLGWPGLRSEYSRLAPHDGVAVTKPGQIGVVFTGHRDVAYRASGRTRRNDIAPGAATITAEEPVSWFRVAEPTDAVEIYPDPQLVHNVAVQHGLAGVSPRTVIGERDGVVLAVASRLRQVHLANAYLSDVASSELAHAIIRQLLIRYGGADPRAFLAPGRLSAARVDQVSQYIDAHLSDPLDIPLLASVTQLSPYHFARTFRAATGMAPHAFVTARRMMRARIILERTAASVEEAAGMVGYRHIGHFRRAFVLEHGVRPSELRAEHRKIRPVEITPAP